MKERHIDLEVAQNVKDSYDDRSLTAMGPAKVAFNLRRVIEQADFNLRCSSPAVFP